MPISPSQSSYRIGQVVSVSDDVGGVFVQGNTLQLLLADLNGIAPDSAVIATATAGAGGTFLFSNITIPSYPTGSDRFFKIFEPATTNEVASELFTLLPANSQRLSLSGGLGL